jgi:hypothetical protein
LSLTQRERAYAKGVFHRIRGQKFGTHKEVFAIATCLYAVEISETDGRRAHPNVPEEMKPKEFRLETLNHRFRLTKKEIRSAFSRIESWIRTDSLQPRRVFDDHREEHPIEYEDRLTEVLIESAES